MAAIFVKGSDDNAKQNQRSPDTHNTNFGKGIRGISNSNRIGR